ncbi:Glucooligosaccharide oxidase [Amniculicola lignicola CBS 123094]|uniref:Glucooligosaccharide oxidase n=1 Tax=Amniculicola lignicola CBS 123094 TaxID=1392246 RepID=A0A6A5W9S2_9PLEO|nr:Glucooligosaccharide oxidase [Amniculicola lignicola CBS 123094]
MGNNPSSNAVSQCLSSAVGGNAGLLAFKSDPLYQLNHVKPYNLDIHITPAAVTYPKTADHVAAIVKCAVDYNLKVQPRSGGHSYANYGIGGADGVIVVDLKNFQQFSIDKNTWQATIGGGSLLGDVTKRLHDNGKRAMAHGTCPQVGIGGHATIGGLGPTSRMWGSALDHVEEVQVVLANSSIIRASSKENTDVFFALKGAGASFGIITEFKVRTQAEPSESVLYTYTINAGNAASKANTFKKWQALIADPNLSRKFASQFILTELGVIITGTFFGPKSEYDALNITSRLPSSKSDSVLVLKDWLGVVGHWAEDVGLQIGGGIQSNFYAKSLAYTKDDTLSDEAVDKLFTYLDKVDKGTLLWFVIWDLEGGAINDVAPDATAYGHRNALFYHQSYAVNLVGRVTPTIRNFLTGLNKIVTDSLGHELGAYAGYVDPALGDNGAKMYWGDNLPRLQSIKAAVDPKDIFHNPQSVRPAKA